MPENQLRKVSVQNAAARLLADRGRCAHITPVLRQLHWLSVQRRVVFKIACLVHQSLASNYAHVPHCRHSTRLRAWSSFSPLIFQQDTRCSTDTWQLWRQKLCCCRTTPVEQFTYEPATDDQLWTVQATSEITFI